MSIDEETLVAPKIVKKLPKVVQTKQGEATTLEVKAIGKPQPTPKWLKANEEIIPSDDYLIENYPDGTSVLTITNVQPETIDQITFEAVSPVGIAKTATKLRIEGILSRDNTMDESYFEIFFREMNSQNYTELIFYFAALANTFETTYYFHSPHSPFIQEKNTLIFALNTKTLFDIQLTYYFV